ncbi:DUF4442 domain-containing protein [Streptomyces calidiresistens]|uniref:DUF4442 domain-containing protein n=1 Tax=Streptomyces calidiresistens TaxID=1485586 RepID=A0A7W3T7J0_9ACTN|nr:DUF4442 domain-containing protein [Streptomyces calidiresistens]MBB0232397.1 DUF4442 domain-containing protein [Streptomyces calidiresistens]
MSGPRPPVGERLINAVPLARTLGLEVVEAGPDRAVVVLPDRPAHHNHLGGPHAGAAFTLAESASGAVVLAAFGHLLDRAVPLAVRAEIAYHRFATGELVATAELGRPAAEVETELDGGTRPEFPVRITITRADGAATASMTVVWTLRPGAPPAAAPGGGGEADAPG